MKSALKFLFVRGILTRPLKWMITVVLTFAMLAAEFLWLVPQGEEDFLLSKMMFNYVIQLTPMVITIFINTETAGNRAIRALPCAKALYTRALPVFSGIIYCGTTAVFMLLYAAGVLIMGESPVQISEMLAATAPMMAFYSLAGGIAPLFRYGMLTIIYPPMMFNFLPILFPISEDILINGTGLPMWAAVLIFIGAAVVPVMISCASNSIIYKHASFRPLAMNTIAAK